ncbi:MAG: RNA 2',3'-cyclic phosphodiesterase [Fodinibius sp.]|nr:RNA 2',3'-cyclic phosphodiesterase [Fodinibius sp.]
MRLFIAVPISAKAKDQLVDLQQPIEGVRWEPKDKLHLTIKFLGDTASKQVRCLQQQLGTIQQAAFSLSLQGMGYFPKGKQPKVLWAGVKKSQQLIDLHHKVEKVCTGMGFDADSRPFKPHITLGRINGVPKRDMMSFINEHKQFRIPELPVHEFVLYESKLDSTGAKHSRVETFSLPSTD